MKQILQIAEASVPLVLNMHPRLNASLVLGPVGGGGWVGGWGGGCAASRLILQRPVNGSITTLL